MAARAHQDSGTAGTEEADVWDDDVPGSTTKSNAMSGWGNAVSTVVLEHGRERDEGTLHSFAISGDTEGAKALLQEHPGINVNEIDEYVSTTRAMELSSHDT